MEVCSCQQEYGTQTFFNISFGQSNTIFFMLSEDSSLVKVKWNPLCRPVVVHEFVCQQRSAEIQDPWKAD